MLLVISFLIQVALTMCCSCEERREYYASYSTTQPAYEYPEYQYNPYSPTGYCYKYEPYTQPSYETSSVSAILYPYPVPVTYESPKEESRCGCERKHTESTQCSEKRYREDDDKEYTSSRCTCTCTERERTERRYETDRDVKPSCGCRQSEEYRRDDRYYDREEDFGRKVKCVCVYDEKEDFRDDEDWDHRSFRREEQRCRHRENNKDCGCSRKKNQYLM
ncbi:hypothetical protein O0L34_g8189 [Tuta absoluta]|nr:hypothetical protein O0L34_g8189 [Tuta absoluta]